MEWAAWKPVLTAWVLPPVPALLLIVIGARLIPWRRGWGYLCVASGVLAIWFGHCNAVGIWLQDHMLRPPAALSEVDRHRLAKSAKVAKAAIVVLGGGREPYAAEYGVSDLSPHSAERLRYGIWLGRQTGVPLAFSGGVGWAQAGAGGGPAEADVAAHVAQHIYGWPIRWRETQSADTRGNAALTVAMLAPEGVTEMVLVTDAFHMPRALRAFEEAAQAAAASSHMAAIRITPAPVGAWKLNERPVMNWLPTTEGGAKVREALRELLGRLAGH